MANYGINLVDNGDGSWSFGLFRAPAAFCSGGTNLNGITASLSLTGSAITVSGFQQAGTNTADGLSHVLRNPGEVMQRCVTMIVADRSFNGS